MQVKKITKEEVNELPLLKYEGKYEIIEDEHRAREACDELSNSPILGFDTETKPAFKKGQMHDVALLQLATPDKAYLFRLNKIGLIDELNKLFSDPNIEIVGVGIRDDIKDLQKLNYFEPSGFVDLNELAVQLDFESIGARNLAGIFMNKRISKSQQVSNWENEELTPAQISYAATDAWICLDIYEKMKALQEV